MPPTPQSTLAAATLSSSAKPSTPYSHQPSILAMIVLLLFMMAALTISVILRQRKDIMEAFRHYNNLGTFEEKQKRLKPRLWPRLACSRPTKHRSGTAADSGAGAEDKDSPTAVGTLHVACVLLAAAHCQVFSPPMAMHFRIPLYNSSHSKTVLIIGIPWLPALACGAQCSGGGAPAVRI